MHLLSHCAVASTALAQSPKPPVLHAQDITLSVRDLDTPRAEIAMRRLAMLGVAAVPALNRATQFGTQATRLRAVRLLGRLRHGSSVGFLGLIARKTSNSAIRMAAVDGLISLMRLRGKEARLSGYPEVEYWLVQELQRVGGPAVAPLLGAVSHADPKVRRLAASALGMIKDRRAVPALIRLMETPRRPTMDLPNGGTLKDEKWEVHRSRYAAVEALGQIGAAEAIEPLLRWSEGNVDRRNAALRSLWGIRHPRAVETLLKAQGTAPSGSMVLLLAQNKDPRAFEMFERLMKAAKVAEGRSMWESESRALLSLDPLRAEEPLRRLAATGEQARFAVLRAKARFGDSAAVAGLVSLLAEVAPEEQKWDHAGAIAALGSMPRADVARTLRDAILAGRFRGSALRLAVEVLRQHNTPEAYAALRTVLPRLDREARFVAEDALLYAPYPDATPAFRRRVVLLRETMRRLAEELDGSKAALERAWRPALLAYASKMSEVNPVVQPVSPQRPMLDLDHEWAQTYPRHTSGNPYFPPMPVYRHFRRIDGSPPSLAFQIRIPLLTNTLDPLRGFVGRGPQLLALFWREGGAVKWADLTYASSVGGQVPTLEKGRRRGNLVLIAEEMVRERVVKGAAGTYTSSGRFPYVATLRLTARGARPVDRRHFRYAGKMRLVDQGSEAFPMWSRGADDPVVAEWLVEKQRFPIGVTDDS